MSRNKLYAWVSAACLMGYLWTGLLFYHALNEITDSGICFFRRMTGIPCPSCGSTRAVLSILHGDLTGALIYNPLGFLIFSFLLIVPFWIILDLISAKSTFFFFYKNSELFLKRKFVAISLILLFTMNWIWNICKL